MKAKTFSRKAANNQSTGHVPLPASALATEAGQDLPPSADPRAAEIVTIFNAHADLVTKANLLAEYGEIRVNEIFSQVEENRRPGRPGIVSMLARELAMPGRTEVAKRNCVDRALRIGSMPSPVQEAAVAAKLGQNQSALLEIADAGSEDHQFAKIVEIIARKAAPKTTRKIVLSFAVQREGEVRGLVVKFANDHNLKISG